MVAHKLRYLLIFVVLLVLFHNPHKYHVNPINDNEYDRLSQNQVLTNIRLFKYPKFLHNSTPDLILIRTSWWFNYFIHVDYKPVLDLKDKFDIIISDFHNNPIEQSAYLGFGIYYHYIYKFQWDRIVQKNIDNKNSNNNLVQVPVVRAIDVFNTNTESREHWYSIRFSGFKAKSSKVYLHFLKIDDTNLVQHLNILNQFSQFKSNEFIKFNSNSIKIFQISDLHFFNGQIDSITETFLINSINNELPHLIIINGDLINFRNTHGGSWPFSGSNTDFLSKYQLSLMLLSALNLFIKLKIPYIVNFGDSDYEYDKLSLFMLEFISNLPYCLNHVPSDFTQKSLHGLTNYNFNLYLADNMHRGVISLLDSFRNDIESNQINNIYRFNKNEKTTGKQNDGKNDKNKESENGNLPSDDLFKLCFIHYPLPNFRPSGKFKIIGSYNKFDALITNTDKSFLNDFLNNDYQVISVSHEHENDGCILYDKTQQLSKQEQAQEQEPSKSTQEKIWLCYSSVTGGQAVTKDEIFDRKLRVFEISKNRLLSWKISESSGKGFDYQLIHEYK